MTDRISERTILVLKAIKKLVTADRRDVAEYLKLQRDTVSSVFTRLERMKLIERTSPTVTGLAIKHPKLTFKVTTEGFAAIRRGATMARSTEPRTYHTYQRAVPVDPTIARPRQMDVMHSPVYVPPKSSASVRPGADDHKQFKSKGI